MRRMVEGAHYRRLPPPPPPDQVRGRHLPRKRGRILGHDALHFFREPRVTVDDAAAAIAEPSRGPAARSRVFAAGAAAEAVLVPLGALVVLFGLFVATAGVNPLGVYR